MDENERRQSLRNFADESQAWEASPPDLPVRVVKRRRRRNAVVLAGTVTAVGALLFAATSLPGRDSAPVASSPTKSPTAPSPEAPSAGTTLPPPSAPTTCPSDSMTFGVGLDQGVPTPEGAVEPWTLDGETILRVDKVAVDKAKVAVGRSASEPRVVLQVRRLKKGWVVVDTEACGSDLESSSGCGEVIEFKGARYIRVPPSEPGASGIGVGRPVGVAQIPGCAVFTSEDGSAHDFVGPVSPVSAYTTLEVDPRRELTIAVDGVVRLYRLA